MSKKFVKQTNKQTTAQKLVIRVLQKETNVRPFLYAGAQLVPWASWYTSRIVCMPRQEQVENTPNDSKRSPANLLFKILYLAVSVSLNVTHANTQHTTQHTQTHTGKHRHSRNTTTQHNTTTQKTLLITHCLWLTHTHSLTHSTHHTTQHVPNSMHTSVSMHTHLDSCYFFDIELWCPFDCSF